MFVGGLLGLARASLILLVMIISLVFQIAHCLVPAFDMAY
jgi:hypothetical protein